MSQVLQYPLEVGGVLTRVLECGAPDARRTLVCFHGSGSRADRWRPVLPALADAGNRVLAVDFPGHGLAAKPAGYRYGSHAFSGFALDLLDRLADEGADQVVLLGTSLGGHVAAIAALERPEQVRATVLVGAVGLVPREQPGAGTATPVIDTSLAGTRAKLEFLVADAGLVTDAWVREESAVNSSPGAREAMAELARGSAAETEADLVGEQYSKLGIPTLLVWGEQDRWIVPEIGIRTARLLGAELHFIPRAGHAPYFEQPETFLTIVRPFIAGQ